MFCEVMMFTKKSEQICGSMMRTQQVLNGTCSWHLRAFAGLFGLPDLQF